MKRISLSIILGISATTLMAQPPGPGGPDTNRWNIAHLDASKLPAPATKTGVTYETDIQPLFKESCNGCHGERRPRGGLRLDSLEAALKGGRDGKVIEPGDSAKSLLVMAVSQLDKGTAMPPKPRGRGLGGPGGPGGGPGGNPPGAAAATPGADAPTAPPPGGQAPGGPGPGRGGPPAKPLTADQVALVRAWIDQGAK